MNKIRTKYRFFTWILLLCMALNPSCYSGQKRHSKTAKAKKTVADTPGMTAEQKKIMLQHTLEEKLHYYYKDSAKRNKK